MSASPASDLKNIFQPTYKSEQDSIIEKEKKFSHINSRNEKNNLHKDKEYEFSDQQNFNDSNQQSKPTATDSFPLLESTQFLLSFDSYQNDTLPQNSSINELFPQPLVENIYENENTQFLSNKHNPNQSTSRINLQDNYIIQNNIAKSSIIVYSSTTSTNTMTSEDPNTQIYPVYASNSRFSPLFSSKNQSPYMIPNSSPYFNPALINFNPKLEVKQSSNILRRSIGDSNRSSLGLSYIFYNFSTGVLNNSQSLPSCFQASYSANNSHQTIQTNNFQIDTQSVTYTLPCSTSEISSKINQGDIPRSSICEKSYIETNQNSLNNTIHNPEHLEIATNSSLLENSFSKKSPIPSLEEQYIASNLPCTNLNQFSSASSSNISSINNDKLFVPNPNLENHNFLDLKVNKGLNYSNIHSNDSDKALSSSSHIKESTIYYNSLNPCFEDNSQNLNIENGEIKKTQRENYYYKNKSSNPSSLDIPLQESNIINSTPIYYGLKSELQAENNFQKYKQEHFQLGNHNKKNNSSHSNYQNDYFQFHQSKIGQHSNKLHSQKPLKGMQTQSTKKSFKQIFQNFISNLTFRSSYKKRKEALKPLSQINLKGHTSVSYANLLKPNSYVHPPYVFNNPRFKQGKHQTVMKMQGYTTSIIPFVKPKKLKDELNEQFQSLNPWLPESMTLSKIHNLKIDIFGLIDQFPDLDISTVACGWVYFERLLLKNVVTKVNRKLFALACFLLSFKFNQHLSGKVPTEILDYIPRFDRGENLTADEVLQMEFKVYVLLEFSLKLSYVDIMPHVMSYLESKDLNFEDVYGVSEQVLFAET